MQPIYGPARVILCMSVNPSATDAMIDQMIQYVPSLQPGLYIYGHDNVTQQWRQVGRVRRVFRDGHDICQEVDIAPGVEVASFPPFYTRILPMPDREAGNA